MLKAVLRAVILAVAQARQLDGSAHIAGIRDGGGQLVHALVAALNQRRRDQDDPSAN